MRTFFFVFFPIVWNIVLRWCTWDLRFNFIYYIANWIAFISFDYKSGKKITRKKQIVIEGNCVRTKENEYKTMGCCASSDKHNITNVAFHEVPTSNNFINYLFIRCSVDWNNNKKIQKKCAQIYLKRALLSLFVHFEKVIILLLEIKMKIIMLLFFFFSLYST